MTNRHIVNRALPQRSMLKFYFPVPIEGSDRRYVIDLPFFENISVSESKRARYAKHSLLARSSDLYSYMGADSRKLKVDFNISLPHLEEEHPEINFDEIIHAPIMDNVEEEKRRFREPFKPRSSRSGQAFERAFEYTSAMARESARQVLQSDWFNNAIPEEDKQIFYSTYGLTSPEDRSGPDLIEPLQSTLGQVFPVPSTDLSKALQFSYDVDERTLRRLKTIDLIIYWVNVVRSSVINHAKTPVFGPPIVRLRHGIMFQDIPCVCTDYRVSYDESAGHDLKTLLPRRIKISMNLEEVRTGDFGDFDPNQQVAKDNLAGWESVILEEANSTDPGVGGLR